MTSTPVPESVASEQSPERVARLLAGAALVASPLELLARHVRRSGGSARLPAPASAPRGQHPASDVRRSAGAVLPPARVAARTAGAILPPARVCRWLSIAALQLALAAAPAGAEPPDEEAIPLSGWRALAVPVSGITVDGRLDDWPAEIPVHPIRSNTNAYGETDISGADLDASLDFSPSFRAGYSLEEQRVYVAVEVRDDSVHARQTGHQDTDALEIYLAARPGAEPVYYVLCPPGGAYGPGRPNPSVLVPALGEMPLDRSGSRGAVGREGGTTIYEWSLELLGDSLEDLVELRPGMTLGFDVAAVDQDSETGTAAWVSWTPPTRKFSGGGRIGGLVLGRGGGDLGAVTLRVQDEAGEALAGAWFELWQDETKVTAALTDARGRSSAAVPEGTYEIRVAGHGFHTQVLERRVARDTPVDLDVVLKDLGTRFHVDDDASPGGDGSEARPFATIAAALAICSPGDTVQLAPGTYHQPLELIPHVTILGAGHDRTRVAGEAHWGLGLRPLITYYGGRGEDMWAVHRPGVTMAGFTLDGGGEYPDRTAEEVSDLLAVVTAIGHRTLGTYATEEDAAVVRELLEARPGLASARIHAPGAWPGGSTLLHRVVSIYDDASDAEHEIARLLIEHGADVNALGGQARGRGETALGYAGFFGDSRLVRLYLAHGGDPNRPGASGLTPLDVTAHEGSHVQGSTTHIPALEALIEAGGRHDPGHLVLLRHISRLESDLDADPALVNATIPLRHARDEQGTPLHEAADGCDAEIAGMLLDRGADVDALDTMGQTPLQRAARRGCGRDLGDGGREFLELLFERGSVDLTAAVVLGDAARVAAILEADPGSVDAADPDGWTPLDVAVDKGRGEIEALLRAAGAPFGQNVEAMLREAPSGHGVRRVMARSDMESDEPGYLHVEPSESLDIRGPITLAAWVYRVDDGGTAIGKWRQLDEAWSYVLHLSSDDGFHLHWEDGTQSNLTDFAIPYHQWAHVAATWDGSRMAVYVNGEQATRMRVPAGKRIASTGNPVWIGSSGYGDRTPGLIDDVQIWNVARTPEQIRESMLHGLGGDEPGLAGWWPMDAPRPLADGSPHGNHGRLQGVARVQADGVPVGEVHAPEQALWLLAPAAPRAAGGHDRPQEPPVGRTAFAVPVSGITVDGRLDDWPADMPVYRPREITGAYGSTDLTGTDLDESADFSPSFRVGYSLQEQRVYVAIEARDDRVHVTHRNVRSTDAGEVYLGGRLNTAPFCYSLVPPGGSYRPAGNPLVSFDDWDEEWPAERVGAEIVFGRAGDVSVYEWSLPALGATPEDVAALAPGQILPFDLVAVDSDRPGDTSAWIAWGRGRPKSRLEHMGRLVLAGSNLGTLEVRALSSDAPVAGAGLELWRDGVLVLADETDGGGLARHWLPPGRYTLAAAPRGYQPYRRQLEIPAGASAQVTAPLQDRGTRFHVDDDASPGGDGSAGHPFGTIQEALNAVSYGDTVQLAPGVYSRPLELISGVTILGAGPDRTRVTGEAHWGLAQRPFIGYYNGLWNVELRDVVMDGFTLEHGESYPARPAREVADGLALAMAVDAADAATVRAVLQRAPGAASDRILSPDADPRGSTFLHRIVSVYADATDAEHEIARLLIEHGADVNALGGQARGRGETALGYAGFFADSRLVELYLAHGADPNRVNPTGGTPVDATAREGSHQRNRPTFIPAFEALVRGGGRYHLGHLVLLGHTERLVADLDEDPGLVDEPVPLRYEPDVRATPLHQAVNTHDEEIARLLLDRGARVEAVDSRGRTPLHLAAGNGSAPVFVELLLERGADLEALDAAGRTPLARAVYNRRQEKVELLMERGARVHLFSAAALGDSGRVRALLAEDPKRIQARDGDGKTALGVALDHGREELIDLLREHGVDDPAAERRILARDALTTAAGLTEAMKAGDADGVRSRLGEGEWLTVPPGGADLFDGETLQGWWPLTGGWRVEEGLLQAPTSRRIQFLLSQWIAPGPFELRAQVQLLERGLNDGKMLGFLDAAGRYVQITLDDEPDRLTLLTGRKYFRAEGIRGTWNVESSADRPMEAGAWYDVVCRIDGSEFTVSAGEARLSHPFEVEFPVFLWLEVQRTGGAFRGLRVQKL